MIDEAIQQNIVGLDEEVEVPVLDWKKIPECNRSTALMFQSREIDVRAILSMLDEKERPVWHLTRINEKEVALREYRRRLGNVTTACRYSADNIIDGIPCKAIEGLGRETDKSIYLEVSPPPMLPDKIVRMSNEITEMGFEPCILYKPDTWKEVVSPDPALVANLGQDNWRVFAIWGGVVEQAEIISFMKC